jgi:hypothetical protein
MPSSSLRRELSIQLGSQPLRPSPARSYPGRPIPSREHRSTVCQRQMPMATITRDATRYPVVQIVNTATGHVFFAKAHGHSTMGVATGSTIVSTNFDVPAGIETGASSLFVIANGVPSAAAASRLGRRLAASPSPQSPRRLAWLRAVTATSKSRQLLPVASPGRLPCLLWDSQAA